MALPTHRVEIRKTYAGHSWANDYLIVAASMDAAATQGAALLAMERPLHNTAVNFDYVRTSTMLSADRVFRHTPINLPGTGPGNTGEFLPLFNVIRVDLGTGDYDPCRKYYRSALHEGVVANGNIGTTFMADVLTFVNAGLFGSGSPIVLVSSKGHQVISASVHPVIQERQLRRRRRKKAPVVVEV